MINTINLPPFKRMCVTIGNLPSSFMESMSYYEALCWLWNYLDKTVIPAINTEGEAITELQTAFTTLKSYVDNYFDNLDIQTEIDNKLDEMAESGELADIIAQYLDVAAVLGFDTIADMSDAENLANGSICRCLGQNSYNDGKGAFYKVRQVTVDDTVDGFNIVALDVSDILIAERLFDLNIQTLQTQMSLLNNKKVIIVGDSYANRDNSWADRIKSYSGLGDNCVIKKYSGVGFYTTADNKNFGTLVVDNIPFTGSEVTDIIVCGGYNDQYATYEQLSSAFNSFVTTCKTNYPNAKIYVGFIGWCKPGVEDYSTKIGNLAITRQYYKILSSKYDNVYYLNNVEYALHLASEIDSSYFHPTADGQFSLATAIMRAWLTGSCTINSQQVNVTSSVTYSSYITSVSNVALYSLIDNGTSKLFNNGEIYLAFDETTSFTFNNSLHLKIGTLTDGYVFGRGITITECPITALVNTKNNGYFCVPCNLYISEGDLYLRLKILNRTGNGWIADSLKYISIYGIQLTCDSMTQY